MESFDLNPRIETLEEKRFAGNKTVMSYSANKTPDLWRRFMPRKSEIGNTVGPELYSIEIYPQTFFERFDPTAEFEKWAAVEIAEDQDVPDIFESLVTPGGLYAVFDYRGKASDALPFYQAIFGEWLPASGFVLDERPHFAVMGEKYKNDSDDSEEEIWIPVTRSPEDDG